MWSTDGRILSANRLAVALGAVAISLALVLTAQLSFLFGDQPKPTAALLNRPLDLPGLANSETWPSPHGIVADGHSLFMSKTVAVPPPAPAQPAQPAETQEQLTLVAIVIGPGGRFALLRSQTSQQLSQLQQGGSIDGWTLAAVEPNRLILTRGGQQSILYLPDTIPENP